MEISSVRHRDLGESAKPKDRPTPNLTLNTLKNPETLKP